MKLRKLIAIGVLILIGGLLVYLAQPSFLRGRKPPVAEAQVQGGRQQRSDAPAENPAGEAAKQAASTGQPEEAPTIEIPPEKQQLIGVKTAAVAVQPLQKMVRTVGKIEYDERRLTTVNTKVEGWIEKLYVNFTGIYVKKGEPLVDIYSPELWATQQEFINLVRWAKKTRNRNVAASPAPKSGEGGVSADTLAAMLSKDAESIVEAARQRLKLWDISDDQIRRIEESEKPIRTLTIYSPASGYVLQKYAVQGMKVMAGEKLYDVTDLSQVWVVADIYEYELPLLKTGDTASIQLSYFPGRQFVSKIEYIYPTLSGETRTAKARFVIPNPGGQLKPQMFTNIEIGINLGTKLAVPEDAVIDTGLRQIAYVDKGGGYFEPREVRTGVRAEKMVEVTAGLKAGDKVASSANFLIDSEAKLKGVAPLSLPGQPKTTTPQQAPAPQHRH